MLGINKLDTKNEIQEIKNLHPQHFLNIKYVYWQPMTDSPMQLGGIWKKCTYHAFHMYKIEAFVCLWK